MKRLLVIALLLGVSVLETGGEASAYAQCTGSVDGEIGGIDGGYGAHGSESCSGGETGSGSGGYVVIRHTTDAIACPGIPDGLLEIVEHHAASGELTSTESHCIDPLNPGDPAPPPPPSPTEVVERLPLPIPEVHTSPPGQGLVGFETWLWWGGDTQPPPLTVTVGEWTATVAPVLESVTWDMGNGDTVAGDGAGSEEHPSARYTYERHCECTITVTATWGGTVTLSHPLLGAPIQEQATGVPFTTSQPYDVIEREAVIVG